MPSRRVGRSKLDHCCQMPSRCVEYPPVVLDARPLSNVELFWVINRCRITSRRVGCPAVVLEDQSSTIVIECLVVVLDDRPLSNAQPSCWMPSHRVGRSKLDHCRGMPSRCVGCSTIVKRPAVVFDDQPSMLEAQYIFVSFHQNLEQNSQ